MKKNFTRLICCVMAIFTLVFCCSCGKDEEPVLDALPANLTELAPVTTGVASFIDAESGKLGLIDSTGAVILEPEYKSVKFCAYCGGEGACILTKEDGTEYTFRQKSGKLEDGNVCAHGIPQPLIWDDEQGVVYDMAGETEPAGKGALPQKGEADIVIGRNGKYGIIDHDGKLVSPPAYDDALPFVGGLAAVKKDGRWGYVNYKNETVIGFYYDNMFKSAQCDSLNHEQPYSADKDGIIPLMHDGLVGIYNTEGEMVCSFKYRGMVDFNDGMLACKKGDGTWLLGNLKGVCGE